MPNSQNATSWSTTIVVIDDERSSVLLLERVLKQEGYRVSAANNAKFGRSLVKTESPDLVLMDIQMPGETGLEACLALKADPDTADVPIIFLTSSDDLRTKLEGFKAGAADYIVKPFRGAEVLARIQVHIRARKAMRLLMESQISQLGRLGSAVQAILADPAALPQAHYAVHHKALEVAGGDFYEVLQAGDSVFDYVVADVCGHNADASLVTSALKVLLYQGSSTLNSPPDTIRMVNRAIFQTFPEEVYLSLAWLRVNRNRHQASLYLAGHPQALHLAGGEASFVGASGDVVGAFSHIEVDECGFRFSPGDRVLLYTDGLIELAPTGVASSRQRGMERLRSASLAAASRTLPDMVRGVAEGLVSGVATVADDILLLGVEAP